MRMRYILSRSAHLCTNKVVLEEHLSQLDTAGNLWQSIFKVQHSEGTSEPLTGLHHGFSSLLLDVMLGCHAWKTLHCEACDYDEIMHIYLYMPKCSPWNLLSGKFCHWWLQKKEEQVLNYKQIQVNLQFTHFTAVSLKTHLYGAANKNTSDSLNPAEKEDELDCSLLLWKRDSTHKTNSHHVKAHVVVTDDYGEGLALYFTLCTVYSI